MKKIYTSIFTIWLFVLIIIASLCVKYSGNSLRILIPTLGLLSVYIVEYLTKIKLKSRLSIFLRRILAVPFLTFGFNWIVIFTLTAYRNHHRPFMIPSAIVFLTIGLMLAHYRAYAEGSSQCQPNSDI